MGYFFPIWRGEQISTRTKQKIPEIAEREEKILPSQSVSPPGESAPERADKIVLGREDFEISSEKISGILHFKMPEELGQGHSRVKVYEQRDGEIEQYEISPDEIRSIIRDNKNIQKVVIEKFKANAIQRVQLITSLDSEGDKLLKFNRPITKMSARLGQHLNQHFLKNKPLAPKDHGLPPEEPDMAPMGLSLKSEVNKDLHEFELRRESLERKNIVKKDTLSNLYYNAENHLQLFELGKSYLNDYNHGLKSFAFHSLINHEDCSDTICGISSFLGHQSNLSITIFTNLHRSIRRFDRIGAFSETKHFVQSANTYLPSLTSEGVQIFDYRDLTELIAKNPKSSFEDVLKDLTTGPDTIMWDIPSTHEINTHKELYFPITQAIDNVGFLLSPGKTTENELRKAKEYFERYHVRIKGVIFSTKGGKA